MSWQLVLEAGVGATQPLLTGDRPQCVVNWLRGLVIARLPGLPQELDLLAIEPEIVPRSAELMLAFTPARFEAMMKRPVAEP